MRKSQSTYQLFPLGDMAITADFGKEIDQKINKKVIAYYRKIAEQPPRGVTDIIPAYSSLTICYNPEIIKPLVKGYNTVYDHMYAWLDQVLKTPIEWENDKGKLVKIPVCYDGAHAPDLDASLKALQLDKKQFIKIHTSRKYRVYMLGFLPGFAYLGELDKKIILPRKDSPVAVKPGSVGIAGKQTGIYPVSSPGGWQVIGQTPLELFDGEKETTLLKPGDEVEFYSITEDEYRSF